MSEEKIEQKVEISDQAQVGSVTLIGKFIKQAPLWQDAIWRFLAQNPSFVGGTAVLNTVLVALFLSFKDLHRIGWVMWGVSAVLLTASAWGWYFCRQQACPAWQRVVTGLYTCAFVAMFGWQAWLVLFPTPFEPKVLGIALAEPGMGANHHRSEVGQIVANQIYNGLCQGTNWIDLGDVCRNEDGPTPVVLRRIGVIPDAYTAVEYGRKIGAEVVIWGEIISADDSVTIRFQVLETLNTAVNPRFPLILPVTMTSADVTVPELDLENNAMVEDRVAQQAHILSAFTLGLVAYMDRDFAQAADQLQTAVDELEDSPGLDISKEGRGLLYLYLGKALNVQGRFDEALAALKTADEANPKEPEPAIALSLAIAHGVLGQATEREMYLNQALDRVATWLAVHPDDDKRAAFFDQGLILREKGQPELAIGAYRKILELDPNYYIAYIALAQTLITNKEYAEAIEPLLEAIKRADEADTNSAWAYSTLAQAYEGLNQPEQARQAYEQALVLESEVEAMHLLYAEFLSRQGEVDAALIAYGQLIEAGQDKAWAYEQRAKFEREQGLLALARQDYKKAETYRPDDALLLTGLAEICALLQDKACAEMYFEKAVAIGGVYYVFSSYGSYLYQQGDCLWAATMFEEALRLQPDNIALKQNLAHLYFCLNQDDQAKVLYLELYCLDEASAAAAEARRVARERLGLLGMDATNYVCAGEP